MNSDCVSRVVILGMAILLMPLNFLFAQEKCGTVEYTNQLLEKKLLREERDGFEEWLKDKKKLRELRVNASDQAIVYRVPVVVHIIHKGESVGVGTNLSEAQILSQIKVLNADFKRLNADTIDTPDEFLPVASKFNIEFVLAKQDPDGKATSGIVRVKGTKNQWGYNDDTRLKALSYWPAEDYLNIWVTDLSSTLLGYAQFPVSDLSGLEDAEDNRLTDGVVIDYTTFGSKNDGAFNLDDSFNQGRTTVHELGHFFGLRHTWGDDNGSCGGSGDYVSDTPNQSDYTDGCPSHPYTTCSAHTMFQNYMDYTNDICMNLFTAGQVDRMLMVIQNSPRRKTLTSSSGLLDPAPVANDLGIKSILSPLSSECGSSIQPVIEITNKGNNLITSAVIKLSVNNVEIESKSFTLSLAKAETAEVKFSALSIISGSHQVMFEIMKTNGAMDGKATDNASQVTTIKPYSVSLPFSESFNSLPSTWVVSNPDQQTTWSVVTAQRESSSNKVLYINYYDNDYDGAQDMMTTPAFDLNDTERPRLIFDVAYSQYRSRSDGLEIYLIAGCEDLSESVKIYSKFGSDLASTSSATSAFTPSSFDQWRREVIDLTAYAGNGEIQLAFVGISDGGNNLYLDNISVVQNVSENLTVLSVLEPSPVRCSNEVEPKLTVQNNGLVKVNNFKIVYSLNDGDQQFSLFNVDVSPGEVVTITLPEIMMAGGANTLTFEVIEPNGLIDTDTSDNRKIFSGLVSQVSDHIPLRENFDGNTFTDLWSIVNPAAGMTWSTGNTNFGQSLYFNAYDNPLSGDEAWLVSPSLDLSSVSEASVFFDLSYRSRLLNDGNDKVASDSFQVMVSTDCGNSYPAILWEGSGVSLSATNSSNEWEPSSAADWSRNFINLSEYVGNENVRIAFVAKNGNGNNLYLDNIEFFLSDNSSPYQSNDLYTLYGTAVNGAPEFHITFNLPDRQPVQYELVDMMGRQLVRATLDDVLNQTFTIPGEGLAAGVYIVRLHIDDHFYSQRVYAGQ